MIAPVAQAEIKIILIILFQDFSKFTKIKIADKATKVAMAKGSFPTIKKI